jgi:DNA polymerase-1
MASSPLSTETFPSSKPDHQGTKKGHVVLIDGSGFIFRAFHALPPMTRSDGTVVNAVYGFTNMILKYLGANGFNAGPLGDHLAVIFDAGRLTFRQDIYPAYKSHRPEVDPDLIPQFSLIRQSCEALGIPSVEMSGYEADDLIATYAAQAVEQGLLVTIVSGDKDLMQLVSDQVRLIDPLKDRIMGIPEVYEKFGVSPEKVTQVQALAGDSSDGVPGVPGIGIKTAAQLIQTYGSLEELLARVEEIPQPKRRDLLKTHAEQARISLQLVHLKRDVPVTVPISHFFSPVPSVEKALSFLEEMEFKTLIPRIKKLQPLTLPDATLSLSTPSSSMPYTLVQTWEDLDHWIEKARQAGRVAVDTETTSLDPDKAELVGISLAVKAGEACYIPVDHKILPPLLFSQGTPAPKQLDRRQVLDRLSPLFKDPTVIKIGHNLKYDLRVLQKYDISLAALEDTMLLSYVLRSGPHGLDEVAKQCLGHMMIPYKEVTGTGRDQITFDYVPLETACTYAAEDADMTLQLYELFKPQLEGSPLAPLYETIEKPLIPILCAMEGEGILVDPTLLRRLEKEFSQRLGQLEEEIYKIAGHPFNVGSPKQLGEVLFQELQLPTAKKGKSGTYSTDVEVLETLALTHPLPAHVLEWRQLAKLKSTYTEALLTQINPKTHRIHTSYSMATTTTGRLASTDPNLQNIPIRTEEGRKIRSAFVSPPGSVLMSADYSQIELRLLAHYADTPTLSQAFHDGVDIHTLTASQVFHVPFLQVDDSLRRQAKAINFGIIYGISPFGLAKQLGVGTGQASHIIQEYFKQYPGILAYMDSMKAFAREHGYVTTLFGRRCYIPKINDKNPMLRQGAERQAINAPLQGSNADLIKKAMIQLPSSLKTEGLRGKMLLQVHDELILEVPQEEIEKTGEVVKRIMESACAALTPGLTIPLVVDVGTGPNWGAIR